MKYRREIDGLRAVAVIPVVFFHAGIKCFEGGFVGVDVFFVISGYLITTIILSDMNSGKFSIVNFYERRARRILPALFFVMLCSVPLAWLWLLPHHLKDFSESLTAISIFSSNILFWLETGYFGTVSELKPMLHTWSLSVEEQFYVLFPVFLMALWKWRKRWIFGTLLITAILSLTAAHWGAYSTPTGTFFLLHTRGWELAIGSLIAFYFLYKKEQSLLITSHKFTSEVLGLLGLGLIGYSIFVFNEHTPFPSLYALAPTIGTALIIIFSTSDTISGRILSTKLMVGIGLISYSTYLWHQPIFAFARHRSLDELSVSSLLWLSVLSFVAAYFSWQFIEKPFRDKSNIGRKAIFTYSIIGSVAFALFGLVLSTNIDLPERDKTAGKCNVDRNDCYSLDKSKLDVALWGDSFADAFATSLGEELNASNVSVRLYVKSSCPSIISSIRNEDLRLGENFSQECYEHNQHAFSEIIKRQPKYVVLANAYEWYLEAQNSAGDYILIDEHDTTTPPPEFIPLRIKEMVQAFNANNITPILVTPHPRVKKFERKRKEFRLGLTSDILTDFLRAKRSKEVVLSQLANSGLSYKEIDGLKLFCREGTEQCSAIDKNKNLLLYDGSHISKIVARVLAVKIKNIVSAREDKGYKLSI